MSRPRVVAIDGAAGAGKSTLARALARYLELPYVNTGEMYRALAAAALRDGVDPDDVAGLMRLVRALRFVVSSGPDRHLEVEGWPRPALHTPEVESTVSVVARHPEVRSHLRAAQRAMVGDGAVMEGRDIASVVVPEAPVKIFVTAEPEVRARRRAAERPSAAHDAVGDALRLRDARDAVTNPLEPAVGAEVLDTSELDVGAALAEALAIVRRLAPEMVR